MKTGLFIGCGLSALLSCSKHDLVKPEAGNPSSNQGVNDPSDLILSKGVSTRLTEDAACAWRPAQKPVQSDDEYELYSKAESEWIMVHRGAREVRSDSEMQEIIDEGELDKFRKSFDLLSAFAPAVSCEDGQRSGFKCLFIVLKVRIDSLAGLRTHLDRFLVRRAGKCFGVRIFSPTS